MTFHHFLSHQLSRLFPTDNVVQNRYKAFMQLLEHDRKAHEAMAELEEIYYNQVPIDFKALQEKYNGLSRTVAQIISSLCTVSSKSYPDLQQFYRMIDGFGRHLFSENLPDLSPPFAVTLEDAICATPELTGGKAAALSALGDLPDVVTPKGFAVTVRAFNYFLDTNRLREPIDALLAELSPLSSESLENTSEDIIHMLQQAIIPPQIESEILEMVKQLWPACKEDIRFAVRSSALGEDDTISFAGQYRSLLNVSPKNILGAWRKVIESKYSPRALNYRIQCGFLDTETPMGVLVLEMIDPEISGVMYTRAPETLEKDDINIHAVYGLGELMVDGRVVPEITTVARKEPLRIRSRENGGQTYQILPSSKGGTCRASLDDSKADRHVMDDHLALSLAKTGMLLEEQLGVPQDVEWCVSKQGTVLLLQSRPLHTRMVEEEKILECTFEDIETPLVASGGQTACAGIASGLVKHIKEARDLDRFPSGGILVASHALPDYARIIGHVNAVVTEEGSLAGHFASVAREFGVPFIVGMEKAMEKIPDNERVTVNAIEKKVFPGRIKELLNNPCATPLPLSDSPYMRRFSFLMRFVSPLELTDPAAKNFTPSGCRSLHDIIRYCHETAVNSMFQIGSNRWFNTRGIKKLHVGIPIKINVLDVGGGLSGSAVPQKNITSTQIKSPPMNAVLKGLLHPDIEWGDFSHFNWEEHDRLVMNGGIISPDNAMFASHAILARDYANLNLKFGYHFVIVDALCSETRDENQIRFRFSGGGANLEKRILRARFLNRILSWLDFSVTVKHDLVDGIFVSGDMEKCMDKLDMTGRLLGATRLMDMYLKTEDQIDLFVEKFKNGIYHYSKGLSG